MREATHAVPSSEPWRDWQAPRPSMEHRVGYFSEWRQLLNVLAMGSVQKMAKGFGVTVSQGCWSFHVSNLGTSPLASVAFSRRAQKSHGPLTGHLSETCC